MPHRLLIIDDDVDTVDVLTGLLLDAGYDVASAENGVEAFVRLQFDPPPDAILLDLWMPVVGGVDVLAHVRRQPALAGIPVVVLTAAPVAAGSVPQADRVVGKPFDLEHLLAIVREMLSRPRAGGDAAGASA